MLRLVWRGAFFHFHEDVARLNAESDRQCLKDDMYGTSVTCNCQSWRTGFTHWSSQDALQPLGNVSLDCMVSLRVSYEKCYLKRTASNLWRVWKAKKVRELLKSKRGIYWRLTSTMALRSKCQFIPPTFQQFPQSSGFSNTSFITADGAALYIFFIIVLIYEFCKWQWP